MAAAVRGQALETGRPIAADASRQGADTQQRAEEEPSDTGGAEVLRVVPFSQLSNSRRSSLMAPVKGFGTL